MEGICVNFPNLIQFFRFLKGRCHGNQFCFIPDSFARSQGISGSAGPIFTIYAPYCRYWIADERYVLLFFDILRDVAMAINLVAKNGAKLPTTPALIALSFRNGIAYCLANTRIYSYANCSTSCVKMVKIGSVVFELKWGRKWKLFCKSARICLYCQISQQLLNQALLMFQHL